MDTSSAETGSSQTVDSGLYSILSAARFDGPLLNVYTTLAVRLSRSGLFRKEEMWRDAAVYQATVGGCCGVREGSAPT